MRGTTSRIRGWVPRWWRGEGGWPGALLDLALSPAEGVYRAAIRARNAGFDRRWLHAAPAPIPVVSVGNIGIGGAGKTPFAAWLAHRLQSWGERPAIVLRGYGRDEVAVHRELNPNVPVHADPRRVAAALAAAAGGCTVAVLDDGFQHRALRRELDIVLLPVEGWLPRRRLIPRGPWREPIEALRRASLVILTRKTAGAEEARRMEAELRGRIPSLVIARCHLAPSGVRPLHDRASEARSLDELAGMRVVAVTSLAEPRPFVEQLRAAGADVEAMDFPDHHEFDAAEVERIRERAAGRTIIMTRKEAVKLRSLLDPATDALVLEQRVVIETGAEQIDAALRKAVGR